MSDNRIINSLWIGNQLSSIELLTLHSFVSHGHSFHLWVYQEPKNKLPANVNLKDANEIIPQSSVFIKQNDDPKLGIGKGSPAFFADIFRCKLLYLKGGWWVDMDVVCLKPFDCKDRFFFRSHPIFSMVNNIMKAPKNTRFFLDVSNQTEELINEDTADYLLPNKIINEKVKEYKLQEFIHSDLGNRDWWEDVEKYLYTDTAISEKWCFLHWMNEEWRARGISKEMYYDKSTISKLLSQHGIPFKIKKKNRQYYKWHFRKNWIIQHIKTIVHQDS